VAVGAVGVDGVEERAAGVEDVAQRLQRALVVVVAVHAVDEDHRAVADGGNGEGAQLAMAHAASLRSEACAQLSRGRALARPRGTRGLGRLPQTSIAPAARRFFEWS
jgi:hypothetical protein